MTASALSKTRPPSPDRAKGQPERRRIILVFAGLMAGLLLSELNETIFATALPSVVGELRGVDQMLWVTTAYVLAGTIVMPVYGKLSDQISRRGLFVTALVIFSVGSVVGGLSPSIGWLIAGRAIQGLGAGGLLILVQAIIADLIPARQRARYLSAVGAVFALAAALGPVLGGWLTAGIGWRWAFWINLPLGALAIASALLFLRGPRRQPARVRLDAWGITTMVLAVTSVVLLTSWAGTRYAWTSPVIVVLAVAVVAAGLGFVLVERRAVQPLIDLRLFGNRNFTLATVSGLITAVAIFGTIAYLPTYLQMVSGLDPMRSGFLMLSLIAGLGSATVGSAQIVSRTGHYKWLPVIGSGVVALALVLLSTLTPGTDLRVIAAELFVLGAGIGCGLQLLLLIVQNSVPADRLGTATAANDFFREIGVSVGSAAVGALFTQRLGALLRDRLPDSGTGPDTQALTPEAVQQLPDGLRTIVAMAYNDALTPVFLLLVPLLVVSMISLAMIRPAPLATTVEEPDRT